MLEVLEGARPVREAVVTGLVDDTMGITAWMEIGALHRLMREGGSLSGAHMLVDQAELRTLYRQLKALPAVAGVAITSAARESFDEIMAQNIELITTFNVLFAAIISFGVVYNSARISLSERSRELASLRVLGFTIGEISLILLGELALLTLLAIPPWPRRGMAPFDVDPQDLRERGLPDPPGDHHAERRLVAAHRPRRLTHLGTRGPPQARQAGPRGRSQDPGVDA